MFRVMPASCVGCAAVEIGFCANLDSLAIERIARISRALRFSKSQIIPHGSRDAGSALVLRDGMIKVSHTLTDGRQQIVDFLTTGDALVHQPSDSAVSATAEATTNVDACEISFEDLDALCVEAPELGQSLLAAVFGEIERKNQQVMMLGRKRADERVASFVLDFSNRAVRRGEPGVRLRLPMSRAEMADYLSLTTETVSRAFSLLKEEKIILMPKPHDVIIIDRARLLEIASGGASLSVR